MTVPERKWIEASPPARPAPLPAGQVQLSFVVRGEDKPSLEDSFALAAAAGFDGVEIQCDERYSTRNAAYLQHLSQQYMLPVLALHSPHSPSLPGWKLAERDPIQPIEQALHLAEQVGAGMLLLHFDTLRGPLLPWGGAVRRLRHWIESGRLASLQASSPVRIALGNLPRARYWGWDFSAAWWQEVEQWRRLHPWLSLDTTRWMAKSVNPALAFLAAKEQVAHIHLCHDELPQQGYLDWGNFVRTLAGEGYSGTLSLSLAPSPASSNLGQRLQQLLLACRQELALAPAH